MAQQTCGRVLKNRARCQQPVSASTQRCAAGHVPVTRPPSAGANGGSAGAWAQHTQPLEPQDDDAAVDWWDHQSVLDNVVDGVEFPPSALPVRVNDVAADSARLRVVGGDEFTRAWSALPHPPDTPEQTPDPRRVVDVHATALAALEADGDAVGYARLDSPTPPQGRGAASARVWHVTSLVQTSDGDVIVDGNPLGSDRSVLATNAALRERFADEYRGR